MAHQGTLEFCKRLARRSIFESDNPPDSGPCAIWNRANNTWLDDGGKEHRDLKEMGFTAQMRETILMYIHMHEDNRYVSLINSYGETIELFW